MKEFKVNSRSITDRDNISLNAYLRDISHIDRISPEEEVRLTTLIKNGGEQAVEARDALVKANLRFVVSVANQYKRAGVELSDLISEGNMGLIKAAELFDETRGFKFISYAVWWVRQSITNALASDTGIVRMPLNRHKLLNEYNRLQHEIMQLEQRTLTPSEFAEITGQDESVIRDILKAAGKAQSMDAPMAEDSETTLCDMISSDSSTDRSMDEESLRQDIDRIIRCTLTPQEDVVVRNHYGIGCPAQSLEDVAHLIGKTRERTRQLCVKAINKLRNSPQTASLVEYLSAG